MLTNVTKRDTLVPSREGVTELDGKAIGRRLRELRGDNSLQDVAESIGISKSALAMYEIGERIPRDEIKLKLARYYDVSVDALFFADDCHKT